MNIRFLKKMFLFSISFVAIFIRPSLQDYEIIELRGNFGHLRSSTFSVDADYINVVGNEYCNAIFYEGCFLSGHIFKINRLDYSVIDRDSLEGNSSGSSGGIVNTNSEGNTIYLLDGGHLNYGCGSAGSSTGLRTLSIISGNENNLVLNEDSYPQTCVFRFNDGIIKDEGITLLGIERDPIFSAFADSKILSFNNTGELIESYTLDNTSYSNGQIFQTSDGFYHIFYRNNQAKISYLKYDADFNILAGVTYENLPRINPLEVEFVNDKFVLLGEKNFDQDTSMIVCFDLFGSVLWSQELALQEARSIEVLDNTSLLIGSTDISSTKNVKISILQLEDGELVHDYVLGNSDDDEVFNEFLIEGSNLYIQGDLNCCDLTEYGELGKIFMMIVPLDNLVSSNEVIESEIKIFPNPIFNKLTVEYDGEYTVSIFDLYGRKVLYQENKYSRSTIGVEDLPRGTYFVRIESSANNNTIFIEKVIKI